MLFNSGVFALFMLVFAPLYLLARRQVAARNLLLIVASYVFYGWWDPRFLILVAISTSVDYLAALGAARKAVRPVDRLKSLAFLAGVTVASLAVAKPGNWWLAGPVAIGVAAAAVAIYAIGRSAESVRPKYWLFLSLTTNLGILAFFKYFNFFVGSAAALLDSIGLGVHAPSLTIILPVGLSFYTFQAISRTIDSYQRRYDPQYSIVNYAAFHAFFPQLVAGPIERAGHLMPQFESVRPIDRRMLVSGALLFAWGLYQKIVIADNVSPIADALFTAPAGQPAGIALAGVLAFTVQIYCDFCGYSNMARGLARCLGFDLMLNFNLPYFARTPSEFWQRWHISLSRWLRDYLYISLGGNRFGQLKMYRNLMITMLLGGLWHGAAWTFVAWGALHGIYLCINHAWINYGPPIPERLARPAGVVAFLLTFLAVVVAWVFFRADSLTSALFVLSKMADPGRIVFGRTEMVQAALIAIYAAMAWFAPNTQEIMGYDHKNRRVGENFSAWRARPLLLYGGAAAFAFGVLGIQQHSEFIYFRF
jgi:D-alanyl-lipoteichoic acid acyltransferase DltB (MBOAT superfamily)